MAVSKLNPIKGGITSGESADRPSSPAIGDQFYNGTLGVLEIYTASGWLPATGANDFNVALTGPNTSTVFTKEYFSGAYTISSSLSDSTYDIYVYDTEGNLSGYTKTPSLVATGNFNKIVILGGTNGDLLSFTYKTTFTTSEETSQINAGAYISSLSASSMPNVGDSITVTGGNFATDAEVHFTGTGYSSTAAKTVVRNSSTSLTVTRPDTFPASGNPYTMTVTNPSVDNQPTGSNAHKITLTAGTAPAWQTSASLSGALQGTAYSVTLLATDSEDSNSTITYSYVSGSLPTNISFNPSTHVISGTPSGNDSATFSYTVRATDSGGNYSDRTFSILYTPLVGGGTLTSDSTYYYRTFSSNGNLVIGAPISVNFLMVAGGGGTGYDVGGGGGGGGVISASAWSLSANTYSIAIGAGGSSDNNSSLGRGANGQNTTAFGLTAIGGGGGGTYNATLAGAAGGSGGGGSLNSSGGAALQTSGSGYTGYGYAGGSAQGAYGSGGGGGAGGVGSNGSPSAIVNGGAPLYSSISGSSVAYAGGGYGNNDSGAVYNTGYNQSNTYVGYYGFGTNGSGTGSSYPNGNAGVVIIRYPKSAVGE